MDEHDMSWVRTEMALAQAAPSSPGRAGRLGAQEPLRDRLSIPLLTILAALAIAWALPQMLNWLIFNAAGAAPTGPPA